MVGCHITRDTFPWNRRTALSSAVEMSHIQRVLGASSSLVARRVEDGSNDAETIPDEAGANPPSCAFFGGSIG